MTECKTYDQKAIQATGNDSLIYFETTRSKIEKQELQVARSARFTPVLQIATNKQTKQTDKKKTRYEATNKQKEKKIWIKKDGSKPGSSSQDSAGKW